MIFSSFFFRNAYASSLQKIEFKPYGFLRLSTTAASSALASSNAINQVATTQAAPKLSSLDDTSRLTFQAQQSRIGLTITQDKDFQGKLEVDFLDTSKSSPTTQMQPRLRIASVTIYQEGYRLVIGQDWDLFSPLSPYTFNLVGNYFMAGNSGFIRQQLQYLKEINNFELGLAAGLFSSNVTNRDSDVEVSKSPTYATRFAYKLNNGRIGLSALYGNLKYESQAGSRHDTYGLNTFFEKKFQSLEFKSEFYYGQNLANSSANTMGRGTADANVKEWGGFLSFYYRLEHFDIFGGVGMARITNPSELPVLSQNSNNVVVNPGVKSNFTTKLGIKKEIKKSLDWVTEIARFETEYKLTNKNQLNQAVSLETGMRLSF